MAKEQMVRLAPQHTAPAAQVMAVLAEEDQAEILVVTTPTISRMANLVVLVVIMVAVAAAVTDHTTAEVMVVTVVQAVQVRFVSFGEQANHSHPMQLNK